MSIIRPQQLTQPFNITGSLYGTSSWALNVITSSYSFYAETASYSSRTTQTDLYVLNQSGQSIAKGVVVRITGSNNASDIPRVVTASYENDNNSANTLGITTQVIANGALGYVITEGVLTGVDTSNFISGQLIYLGATGSIIGTAPVAPLHAVRLGEVIREQQNNGSIYVRIDNGYEIEELHDVRILSASNGDLLLRSGSLWINSKQLTGSYSATGSLFIVGPTVITSLPSYQTSDFFLIRNAVTAFKISQGVEITSSAQIPLRISNQASQSLLQVSQSGVVTFATFSVDPAGTAPNGGVYFTSASFYVGLD